VSIDIHKFRKGDERQWQVPLLDSDLPAGIMPLFVNKDEFLFHVGTAFLISSTGVIATAAHCIKEAIRRHDVQLEDADGDMEYDLLQTKVKLSVLHIHNDGQCAHFSIWSVANIQIAHPTDIAFGFLHGVDAPTARAVPCLSFRVPSPDDWVQAIGYPTNTLPPIDFTRARNRTFDWSSYLPTLLASTGQVKAIILRDCQPVTKGPCIVTDCPTLPGMSGGPVVCQNTVCGVVTNNLHLPDGADGSALSLFYPALPVSLNLVWNPHPKFNISFRMPLVQAAERSLVKSDGTHLMHRFRKDGDQYRVDPLIEKEHLRYVFDTRADFWNGCPSQPLSSEPS
jgi:hypothetical protein